jgi:hypothetical protein
MTTRLMMIVMQSMTIEILDLAKEDDAYDDDIGLKVTTRRW